MPNRRIGPGAGALRGLVFLVALSTAVGVAHGPSLAKPKAEKKALALFQAAKTDFSAGRYDDALAKLTEAYDLFPHPAILFGKGEVLEAQGKIEEANETYLAVITDDDDLLGKVNRARARIKARMAKPVPVSILSGDVVGAQVLIDGKLGGKTPAIVQMPRGKHVVEIVKEGYKPKRIYDFVARGSETLKIEVTLEALRGVVRVKLKNGSFQDTTVTIDGKAVAVTNPKSKESEVMDLNAGRHELLCKRPDEPPYKQPFTVAPEKELVLTCEFAAPTGDDNVGAWVLLAGGVVAAGLGGFFVGDYFADVDYADDNNKRLESSKDEAGIIALGVGVAAIVAGIVLFATSGDSGDEESADGGRLPDWQLSASPLPNGGAVGLSGTF